MFFSAAPRDSWRWIRGRISASRRRVGFALFSRRQYLALTSTRTGGGDVYLLTFATGDLKRLTFDDASELVDGWSPDSRYGYFSSSARDISSMNDIYA